MEHTKYGVIQETFHRFKWYFRLSIAHCIPVVDFLMVLTELFSLCVMAEVLWANIDWKSTFLLQQGQFGPKFQERWVAPTTILLVRKLRWIIFHAV